MKFKVDEISSVITEEIQNFRHAVDISEVGRVLEVGDGIARVYGLSNAVAGEQLVDHLLASLRLLELAEESSGATGETTIKARSNLVILLAASGKTEQALKEEGVDYKVGKFPYQALGKARRNAHAGSPLASFFLVVP